MCINHILNVSQQRCINTQIIGIKLLENPKEPWEELQSGVSSLSPCAAASHRPQPWYSITTPHRRENCQSHFHFPTQFKANAPSQPAHFPSGVQTFRDDDISTERVKKNTQILSKPVRYDLNGGKSWSGGDAVHCSNSLPLSTSKDSARLAISKYWEGTFTERKWNRSTLCYV